MRAIISCEADGRYPTDFGWSATRKERSCPSSARGLSHSLKSPYMTAPRSAAVFDLGGVLIDWSPRYLYRKLFRQEADMEYFLANMCTPEWNLQQDAGRTFAEACATLKREKPGYAEMIDASGFSRSSSAAADQEAPIYALSNWSAETFPFATKKIRISAAVPRNPPLRRGALGQTRSTNLSTLLRKSCATPGANHLH